MSAEQKKQPIALAEIKTNIGMLSANWSLAFGLHPMLSSKSALYSFPPFHNAETAEQIDDLGLNFTPCFAGHNMMADNSFARKLGIDIKVPVSPIFVKDLAGRIIYIGYGPEKKEREEWKTQPAATFPIHCHEMTPDIEGYDLIENVFFTKFRCLEQGEFCDIADNKLGDAFPDFYWGANLYPYKLRLDTFYQDGWRLPQTELVFAKQDANVDEAENAARAFLGRWNTRPEGQSYEDFYVENNEDDWLDELYEKGCTIIPTIEGENGYNQVDKNFEITGAWNGRAVAGLHEVIKTVAAESPKGTIEDVVSPGYVLAHKVWAAKVIVSDGVAYTAACAGAPSPLFPDLRLPHQRTTSTWGATWLPTHPTHFDAPTIWGWEVKASKRFLQLKGPLWDPLHYHYSCTGDVVRAFKTPLEGNYRYAFVPEVMQNKFHPIVGMKGFDTLSKQTKLWRKQHSVLPNSSVRRIPTKEETCNVGYHPLPLIFEYELDNYWFPELAPQRRVDSSKVPVVVTQNLAKVITCKVTAHLYRESTKDEEEYEGSMHPEKLLDSQQDALKDYPFLKRYVGKATEEEIQKLTPLHLEEPVYEYANKNLTLWGGTVGDISEATGDPFYKALDNFRLGAVELMIRRYELYTEDKATYKRKWWLCEKV